MNPPPISVFLVVKNEAHNFKRALESIECFDEIVIVDSGSDDSTVEIAKTFTDRGSFYPWAGMGPQKEHAKTLCSNDWVLNLDGDEEVKV